MGSEYKTSFFTKINQSLSYEPFIQVLNEMEQPLMLACELFCKDLKSQAVMTGFFSLHKGSLNYHGVSLNFEDWLIKIERFCFEPCHSFASLLFKTLPSPKLRTYDPDSKRSSFIWTSLFWQGYIWNLDGWTPKAVPSHWFQQ